MDQQVANPDEVSLISERLRSIRRRRRLAHWPLLAVPLLGFTFSLLGVQELLRSFTFDVMALVGVACILVFWVGHLKCPRCSREFHMSPRYRNDFARRCLWCGLALNGKNVNAPYSIRSREAA